jgi:hypothetical protein
MMGEGLGEGLELGGAGVPSMCNVDWQISWQKGMRHLVWAVNGNGVRGEEPVS